MSRIFGYFLLERYNINVLILVPSLQGVRGYTVWPYTPTNCMSLKPVEVELQNASIWQLFPHRLRNLHGCPLSVIVWDIPPYMRVHWGRGKPAEQLQGLDGLLLQIVAAKMNFTLRLIPNEPEGLIGGSSYLNGTLTGAYQMLRADEGLQRILLEPASKFQILKALPRRRPDTLIPISYIY